MSQAVQKYDHFTPSLTLQGEQLANRITELRHPYNIEAEALLLGAMMIQANVIDAVADLIESNDFYEPLHGVIFDVIMKEHACGRPCNPVSLRPYFEHDLTMKELGGPSYLIKLTSDGTGIIACVSFAHQIADLSRLRKLFMTGLELIERAADTTIDIDPSAVVERIDERLGEITAKRSLARSVTLSTALETTLSDLVAEAANPEDNKPIRMRGFDTMSQLFAKWQRGELTILGGRPGMGKTAVALHAALAAAYAGTGTLFVSLEMPLQTLMERVICDLLYDKDELRNLSIDDVRRAEFLDADNRKLADVKGMIANWPLELFDPAALKIGQLSMLLRRYKRKFEARGQDLGLVVIDYLQLLKPDSGNRSRYEDVGAISRALKEIAKACGVHILCLSQLSRAVESREDKRPQLQDLRDSGDIEQDADNVVFVYRDEYYHAQTEPEKGKANYEDWRIKEAEIRGKVDLICRKQRQGKTHTATCYFFAEHQAIRDTRAGEPFLTGLGRSPAQIETDASRADFAWER